MQQWHWLSMLRCGEIAWNSELTNEPATSVQGKQYHFPTAHLDSPAQTIRRRNGPWPLSSGPDAISHHMLVLACSALRELARLPVSRTPIKTRAPRKTRRRRALCLCRSGPSPRPDRKINRDSWARRNREWAEYPLALVMQSGKTGIDNGFCSECSANKTGRATDSIQMAAVNEMEGHRAALLVLEGLDSPCRAFVNTPACHALYLFPALTSFPSPSALERVSDLWIIQHIRFLIKMHAALQSETTMIPSVVCWPEYSEQSSWKPHQFTLAFNNVHGITFQIYSKSFILGCKVAVINFNILSGVRTWNMLIAFPKSEFEILIYVIRGVCVPDWEQNFLQIVCLKG